MAYLNTSKYKIAVNAGATMVCILTRKKRRVSRWNNVQVPITFMMIHPCWLNAEKHLPNLLAEHLHPAAHPNIALLPDRHH